MKLLKYIAINIITPLSYLINLFIETGIVYTIYVEYGVMAWNELPDILRCTTSRTEFKRELKTHLFSPYE